MICARAQNLRHFPRPLPSKTAILQENPCHSAPPVLIQCHATGGLLLTGAEPRTFLFCPLRGVGLRKVRHRAKPDHLDQR